ncbi:hypothetical protein DL98DRAFT_508391 [Cadophora sp. DSE1049]|nr:hypothetical protein DL98DRAFT_508391 [Cadophora sp. DSE1049]
MSHTRELAAPIMSTASAPAQRRSRRGVWFMEGLFLNSGVTAVEACHNYSLALHVRWFDLTLRSNGTECLRREVFAKSPSCSRSRT